MQNLNKIFQLKLKNILKFVKKSTLTDIIFIDHGDLSPIQVVDQVAYGLADQLRIWVEIDGDLLDLRLQIEPGLEMRNFERIAEALYVIAEQGVLWSENCTVVFGGFGRKFREFRKISKNYTQRMPRIPEKEESKEINGLE